MIQHANKWPSDQIAICWNPCTMQIIIEHWDDIVLGSNKKKKNAPIIFDLTGIEGYKGRADQRQALFSRMCYPKFFT